MPKEITTTSWPILNYDDLKETLLTVQLWAQIVGKIRLIKTPWINHGWHVTLYVSSRGLTTGMIPFENGGFQIDFDFISHRLIVSDSNGGIKEMALQQKSVADFYKELFLLLKSMDVEVEIYAKPNELVEAIPFAEDEVHKLYDAAQMHNYWLALVKINAVLIRYRAGFTGKCSPVHLFWGAFDLAVSFFSGRSAPLHHGEAPNMPKRIMQEAYSHEVASVGFWAGSDGFPFPAFYAYSYPAATGYGDYVVEPKQAFYDREMGEYFLKYEDVQKADNPSEALLQFLNSTFEAAKTTGNWNPELTCNLTQFEK